MIVQRTRTRLRNDGTCFSYRFSFDAESYIAESSPPHTRSNSEMISYWVYQDWNTIFIMKRNDWSTERMMDVNESWRTVTHFFAGYLANERIKDWYQMPSVVPQQCRHGLSSWKRWFLLERWRWKIIFIMEVNIERKLPRLHEKELQALFFWTYQYNKRETCAWYLSSPLADATFWCAFLSKADGWSVFVVFVVYLELDKMHTF